MLEKVLNNMNNSAEDYFFEYRDLISCGISFCSHSFVSGSPQICSPKDSITRETK